MTSPRYLNIYNPWLKSNAYGNILDQYDNPTYNIRLYMVRKEKLNQVMRANQETGEAIRAEDVLNPSNDMVVLCQTGVTGTQVDNLNIEAMMSGNNNTTRIGFNVTQPGAASFLDQIMLAKHFLGWKDAASVVLVIDVRFQGYINADDDSDGTPEVIAGPFRWVTQMIDLSIAVSEKGSEYEISCIPTNDVPIQNQEYYTLPKDIVTRGETISEHIKSLEVTLNDHYTQAQAAGFPDTIEFNLGELIGSAADKLDRISDEIVYNSAMEDTDNLNRRTSEIEITEKATDHNQKVKEEAIVFKGNAAEPQFEDDGIKHKEGTTLDQVFATLFSMNKEFYEKITRRTDPDDPDSEIDLNKAYTAWCKIFADLEYGEYDPVRKDFARIIKYTPRLYKNMSSNAAYDQAEQDIQKSNAEARAKEIVENKSFHKQYEYIFTGRNTDIINLDIKYDKALPLLVAPRGGRIGNFNVVEGQKALPVEPEKDVTIQGQVNELQKETESNQLEAAKSQVANLMNTVQQAAGLLGSIENALNSFDSVINTIVNEIAGAIGVAADELKGLVKSGNISAVQEMLDNSGSSPNSLGKAPRIKLSDPIMPTESPALKDYVPVGSGVRYAADLTEADIPTGEKMIDSASDTQKEQTTVKQARASTGTINTRVDNATQKAGNPQNTLFGVYVEQVSADTAFMCMIELTVRGDPWFLGTGGLPNFGKSNPMRSCLSTDHQNFWLTIRAPQAYDPDVVNEDNNTGYWKFNNMSHTFSGLYTMLTVTHKFSGGAYNIDLSACRSILGPENLDPQGESAEADFGDDNRPEINTGIPGVNNGF